MSIESEAKEHAKSTRARLFGPTSVKTIRAALPRLTPAELDAALTASDSWREGVDRILKYYDHTLTEIRSGDRERSLTECRRKIAVFLRERRWSYPEIGDFINKDHSSVINLINPERRLERYAAMTGRNWASAKDAAKVLIRAGRSDSYIMAATGATKLSVASYRRDVKAAARNLLELGQKSDGPKLGAAEPVADHQQGE